MGLVGFWRYAIVARKHAEGLSDQGDPATIWSDNATSRPNCYAEEAGNYETEVSLLAEVLLNAGESLESALKRFKRKVMTEDIIKDIKRHAFYLKPGQKMRVKAALARKRSRKNRSRDSDSDASRK